MAGKLPQLGPDSSPRLTLSRAGSPTALPPARSPDPSQKKWAPQRAHAEPDKTAPCPPRREPGYLPLADMPEVVSPHFLRPVLYQWFRPVSSLAPGSGSPGSTVPTAAPRRGLEWDRPAPIPGATWSRRTAAGEVEGHLHQHEHLQFLFK